MTRKDNAESSAMIDGKPAEVLPTPRRDRRLPLKSAQHVRAELARVYRGMKYGELDPAVGTKLAYVLVALGKMIEVGDLEQRIEALENKEK
jgi:hypothetical protein